jgi:hypothetical protein
MNKTETACCKSVQRADDPKELQIVILTTAVKGSAQTAPFKLYLQINMCITKTRL